jgi:hypothetical protein
MDAQLETCPFFRASTRNIKDSQFDFTVAVEMPRHEP